MDLEIQKPEPKISEVEMILIGLFFFVLDCVDFVPGAGDITDVVAAPMGFYYWEKKLNGVAFIVSEIVEAIPGAQEFPFIRSIAWGITIWADRHPKALGKLEAGIEIAAALEGEVEAGEASAAGAGGSKTLDITKGESGAYEYQPGGTRATAEGGASGQGNTRPSEKSTERGASAGTEGGSGGAGKTPEQKHQEAEDLRYREMTDPEGARNPIKETEKKLFAESGPGKEETTAANQEEPRRPSAPAKKNLDDRFAEFQKRVQGRGSSQPPVSDSRDEDMGKAA